MVKCCIRLYFNNWDGGFQVFCPIAKATCVHLHAVTVVSKEKPFSDLQPQHSSTIISFETHQFDFFPPLSFLLLAGTSTRSSGIDCFQFVHISNQC